MVGAWTRVVTMEMHGKEQAKKTMEGQEENVYKGQRESKDNITNPKAWEGEGGRCLPEQNRPLAGLNVLSLPLPSPAG